MLSQLQYITLAVLMFAVSANALFDVGDIFEGVGVTLCKTDCSTEAAISGDERKPSGPRRYSIPTRICAFGPLCIVRTLVILTSPRPEVKPPPWI